MLIRIPPSPPKTYGRRKKSINTRVCEVTYSSEERYLPLFTTRLEDVPKDQRPDESLVVVFLEAGIPAILS